MKEEQPRHPGKVRVVSQSEYEGFVRNANAVIEPSEKAKEAVRKYREMMGRSEPLKGNPEGAAEELMARMERSPGVQALKALGAAVDAVPTDGEWHDARTYLPEPHRSHCHRSLWVKRTERSEAHISAPLEGCGCIQQDPPGRRWLAAVRHQDAHRENPPHRRMAYHADPEALKVWADRVLPEMDAVTGSGPTRRLTDRLPYEPVDEAQRAEWEAHGWKPTE